MQKYVKIVHIDQAINLIESGHDIYIQEKVDGSQFRIEITADTYTVGSHNVDSPNGNLGKMYNAAIIGAKDLIDGIQGFLRDQKDMRVNIFAEALAKPKQNTLVYSRVPKNNFVIFDIMLDGKYLETPEAKAFLDLVNVSDKYEFVPTLAIVQHVDINEMDNLIKTTMSFLGGEFIEGVVLKNYHVYHEEPYMFGQPLFVKYVRADFRERNRDNWAKENPNSIYTALNNVLSKKAIWDKALLHAKEDSKLTNRMQDMSFLSKDVAEDFFLENEDIVKETLFRFYKKDMARWILQGLAEYYKQKIAEEIKGAEDNDQLQ